ncbi:hypothetical protein AQUCO_05300135v1 [Aquilegia coerulea]|uniref:Uncharacterized protein n=1 Tax=Aquilegia coerulea TaxID=218851 RepID=A0A2G5CII6_AQUCA|nr:hypothetical protein AQUCO_05300135v1 [Aquilegia coerulea]
MLQIAANLEKMSFPVHTLGVTGDNKQHGLNDLHVDQLLSKLPFQYLLFSVILIVHPQEKSSPVFHTFPPLHETLKETTVMMSKYRPSLSLANR